MTGKFSSLLFCFFLLLFFCCSCHSPEGPGDISVHEPYDFINAEAPDLSVLNRLSQYPETVFVSGDTIISNFNYPDEQRVIKNTEALATLREKTGLPVYLAVPPRKLDILKSALPEGYPTIISDRLFRIVRDTADNFPVEYINLYDLLLQKSFVGEELYLRTDHHWTSLGAYYAYAEIAKALGVTPYDIREFGYDLFSNSFKGSDSVKLGKNGIAPDSLYLMSLKNDDRTFQVQIRSQSGEEPEITYSGFYDFSCLYTDEKYSVFLSGNHADVKITCDQEKRETLLIVRDSFANALAPFLALHFDIVLIDPRFYNKKLSTVIEKDDISKILVIENMGSLCEQTLKIIV